MTTCSKSAVTTPLQEKEERSNQFHRKEKSAAVNNDPYAILNIVTAL